MCVSVRDGSRMFVGRDYTIVTCGVNLLNLKLYKECLRTLGPGMGWNLPEQLGMQSESSSRSGRHNRGTAAGADAIREQQLKQTQTGRDSSAQRAVRHQITHVGEPGGSS